LLKTQADFSQAGGKELLSEIYKIINFVITVTNYIQNVVGLKIKSVRKRNYWGPPMWILT